MHSPHLLLINLAIVLGVAAVTTVAFQRLRQPVVFGYLLAGLIIGPHVPIPLVADEEMVRTLSELGVILLMFSLGLEFSVRRLVRAGWSVVGVAVMQSSVMMWLGFLVGRAFGWSVLASIYAGAAIAISSTTIIVKAFADQGVRGRFTELVFGVLIIEDLIAILLLALLTPASAGPGASAEPLGLTVVRLVAYLVGLTVIGMLTIPRLVRYVVRLQRPETTLVVCMGICFASAALTWSIGYSVALGAFLAGSLVSESGDETHIARLIEPVRDMFAAIFFVSVGMLIEPALVAQHWIAVVVFTLVVLVGKIGAVTVSAFLAGVGTRTAVQTGMSLAQIGEFSFIIAAVGLASGATSPSLYPIMIAVSAITTLSTPWLIRAADPVAAAIDRKLPRPLQTFVSLYESWIERMHAGPESSLDRARVRRAMRSLLVDAFVIVALSIAATTAARPLADRLSGWTGMAFERGQAVVVGSAVALSAPFLVGIVRTGRTLGQTLSRRAFSEPDPQRLDPAAAPRRALVVTIQLATVLVVGAPVVAITQPFLPPFLGVGLLGASLLVLGVFVWRSATDLQGHVRAASEAIVEAVGRQAKSPGTDEGERALERAYHLLPGLGEPFPVRIEDGSPAAGRSISELDLRGLTGATIIAISRGEDVVLVPDGHEVLQPGDVVALAGSRTATDAAKRLLGSLTQ